ncbi:hypothetical protein DFJ73DRAFT_878035, partial [Zopfochytrium polystomum]
MCPLTVLSSRLGLVISSVKRSHTQTFAASLRGGQDCYKHGGLGICHSWAQGSSHNTRNKKEYGLKSQGVVWWRCLTTL